MKKFLTLLLSLAIALGPFISPAYAAPDWPANVAVEAGGAVVIDADTGAVLYGQQMHESYYPASITKILTALIVLENCDLDEIVEFSRNAVYNVEQGSSNAALDVGDRLSVEETLYAMMLKSANEAANALAEHVAGSNNDFVEMMNEKADDLGCRNSNFENPSGLNGENHYTSAYDMALISRAAFSNESFVKIASTTKHRLPVTKRNPDGLTLSPGNRMIRPGQAEYYNGAIWGKTGYTSLAGNTLVTAAERDGLRLVAVVLKSPATHYSDTKKLLDFGFGNFKNLNISEYETAYADVENDLKFASLPSSNLSLLSFSKDSTITLPNTADFSDARSLLAYELDSRDPKGAAAKITYTYNDRLVGTAYLMYHDWLPDEADSQFSFYPENGESVDAANPETLTAEAADPDGSGTAKPTPPVRPIDTTPFEIPPVFFTIAVSILVSGVLVAGLIMWRASVSRREEEERRRRYERRQQRLKEIGVSSSDFDQLLQQKRRVISDQENIQQDSDE